MQLTKGMPSGLVGAWGGDTLPPAPFAQEIYLTHFPIAGAYYVEDLPTQCGQKRCVKMAWLNLSVLP